MLIHGSYNSRRVRNPPNPAESTEKPLKQRFSYMLIAPKLLAFLLALSGVGWNRFSVFLFLNNGLKASQVGNLKTLGFVCKIFAQPSWDHCGLDFAPSGFDSKPSSMQCEFRSSTIGTRLQCAISNVCGFTEFTICFERFVTNRGCYFG